MVSPSPSMCSFHRRPGPILISRDRSVALRTSSGSPQVGAVQFDQVEGVQEHLAVMALIPNTVKHREAVVVAGNRLAVDDAGPRAQVGQRLDNQREGTG